eukprot:TRINITY_DN11717_c0_g1_i4.p2 TRINITY_DN11717_c0_g1~~TRINITY_DN11717_c0_g1_i4.p2  ORF type:complete len:152 (+),score=17.60 TRINITY_DN11717_c0_g1_i4:1458-1913(+)
MASTFRAERTQWQGPKGAKYFGEVFDVTWLNQCVSWLSAPVYQLGKHHLFFTLHRTGVNFKSCAHLKNSLNGNRPIKRGKDGQEINAASATALMKLMDDQAAQLRKKSTSKPQGNATYPREAQAGGSNVPWRCRQWTGSATNQESAQLLVR